MSKHDFSLFANANIVIESTLNFGSQRKMRKFAPAKDDRSQLTVTNGRKSATILKTDFSHFTLWFLIWRCETN